MSLGLSDMQKDEEFQNRALAGLLTDYGVQTDFEQRVGRRKLDAVADVDGIRVVLEAEIGFHRRAQAIKDADARLKQKLAVAVFAVCYPADVNEHNLAQSELTWTLRLKAGEPAGEWSNGDIAQLAQAVRQAPNSLSGADAAAQLLSESLDTVVQRMDFPIRRRLALALDLPPHRSRGSDTDSYFVPSKRGMLVVATAMLFHHRVAHHLPADRPKGYDGPWPPASASVCADDESPLSAFLEAWRGILAVDYRPVFETGRTALTALLSDPDVAQAVSGLARTVGRVSELVSGLRHDLLGRIFHRVLDTARYDGSYYTSTAAAVLLASLAIRESDGDWSDPNFIASLRVCDPACGTGTLLMAAAERIRDLRVAAGQTEPEDEEALDLHLVEDVLWGYDVNLTATHMAASTLGMLSPTTRFSRMNIHRALLGVFDGQPYLGSLDFLHSQARLAAWPTQTQQVESGEGTAEPPPPMDLVIMNPPFTRDSLRHDQFSRQDELAIKRREKEILEGQPYREAARLSGSANSFLVLADKMLRHHGESTTLSVILPTVMATNPAAQHTREYLANRFHIDTIVSSHDPERIYFSENTSIGEILLICRRWDRDGEKPPTRVINLARNPDTPLMALDTASRIQSAGAANNAGSDNFTIQHVEATRVARGDWNAVNFLSPFLVQAYRTLSERNPYSVPIVPLRALAEVGPAGQGIRDAYTRQTMPTHLGRRALWYHKTGVTQSMLAETDVYIEPKPAKKHLADRYWEQRSNMLLPHRFRLNVARVTSVMLREPTLGSIWTPCRIKEPNLANILCLYLNSSIGLLSMLGERDNRIPSYPSFSLDTLRSLPVPDFNRLDETLLRRLKDQFDALSHETLLPFPRMNDDVIRQQIDSAVTDALNLDPEWVATIRRELASEPSVTNTRAG